ncbi:hypothetical protein RF11_01623 [Thelohanellus kitauei]|uniref:Uncharacterized protein n=1 Tax=Thelohanellus kitauei TaxID=669202 RepID=A0A0C2N1E7_THEKT|nr:hypothetical protein RF11_01623 [Thelohanellus kitauei]
MDDRALCHKGKCTKSVCERFNKTKCSCEGKDSCMVCCQHSNLTGTCEPFKYKNTNETKYVPQGLGCEINKMAGICHDNGRCQPFLIVSPIIKALQSIISGKYQEKIKNYLFNSLEMFVCLFGLLVSVFSTLSRTMVVQNYKILKNIVMNNPLGHDLKEE